MALTNRSQQGATTTSAENSKTAKEFFGESGVVWGSPEEARRQWNDAMLRAVPPSNRGGAHTTSDSLKAGEHFTCAKCGAETALLVEQTGRPGRHHAVCIQCAGVPTLGATIPTEGDAPLPRGKERLEPTYALTED